MMRAGEGGGGGGASIRPLVFRVTEKQATRGPTRRPLVSRRMETTEGNSGGFRTILRASGYSGSDQNNSTWITTTRTWRAKFCVYLSIYSLIDSKFISVSMNRFVITGIVYTSFALPRQIFIHSTYDAITCIHPFISSDMQCNHMH